MKSQVVIVVIAALVLVPPAIVSPGCAFAQEDKVIKTTTDSRGFEKRHTEADLLYETAKQLMSAGQYDKAAVELEKVMAADASRLDALHDLGTCYTQLKAFGKAAAAYQRAVTAHPGDQRLLVNLGYYQMRAKQIDLAMATYTKILESDPENYEANRWLGYIYEKTAESENNTELYEKSIAHYEKALKFKPDDVKTMGSIAKIYNVTGQGDKALAMYERAIPAASDEVAVTLKSQLGKSYIDAGNFAKSVELFGELVEHHPDKSSYRFNLGISLSQLGRHKEALPHLEQAVQLNPDYCGGYQPLATAYEESGRFNEALATVRKGLDVCNNDKQAGLYYEWGKSLEGLGRYSEAISKFQLAANDPTYGAAARKQIKRQEDLIKRAKAIQENKR